MQEEVGIDAEEFAEEIFQMIPSIGNPSVSYLQARNLILVLSRSDDEEYLPLISKGLDFNDLQL